jgi:uridine phosphorylase
MKPMAKDEHPPILLNKHYRDNSVFHPENLLREARRQRGIATGEVPDVCLLDPDGDIVRWLLANDKAERSPHWACYHTDLYTFDSAGRRVGVIGNAVGASFAVLLAEQLFASGCKLLVSITSAGSIAPDIVTPCFVLIDKALRDEGTSYHYLPPAEFAHAAKALLSKLDRAFEDHALPVYRGAAWTTDAPYRETAAAITTHRENNILAVEMEAAALYAFAEARQNPVVCFAHITNQMASRGDDFEKGEADGALASLTVLDTAVSALIADGSVLD